MLIDFADLSASQVYHAMTQTLIPRPIAWVLSENPGGNLNLAPFSYFTAVSSEPPLVMLSIGSKPDGDLKDTRRNLMEGRPFVIHIAPSDLAAELTETSRTLPMGESELERAGLSLAPFEGSAIPRLAGCPIAMACALYEVQEIGPKRQGLIFAEVKRLYLSDAVARMENGRLLVAADKVDPLARLGGEEYASLGSVVRVPRPR
ncbi:MAG: flavin reductase family protein [Marinobacter sp.]|nr:flavin reductase family protein [Marinobacter sp.]